MNCALDDTEKKVVIQNNVKTIKMEQVSVESATLLVKND